jgi:redox-sensitive bicupin YhaK (pirin superfamily)
MIRSDSIAIQRSGERAFFDHGWLQTYHSFSFAGYHDPRNQNWGALRVFNDDTVAPGEGFGTHPHRDMEILTYVLAGELEHKDSMGNVGVVRPGGVQYLSAGTGIAHSEYNHSAEHPVHFVQMWVLPQAAGLKPRYGQVDFTPEQRLNRWLPIASGRPSVTAPIALWQDAASYVARIDDATVLTHSLDADRRAFLFVASGSATLNGDALGAGDAARIAGPIDLSIGGNDTELILWDVPSLSF